MPGKLPGELLYLLQRYSAMKRLLLISVTGSLLLYSCAIHLAENGMSDARDDEWFDFYNGGIIAVADLLYILPPGHIIHTRFGLTTTENFFRDVRYNRGVYSRTIGNTTLVYLTTSDNKRYVVHPVRNYEWVEERLFWFWKNEK